MMTRRSAMAMMAALCAAPAAAQTPRLFGREGGVLLPLGDPGDPARPIALGTPRPWGQVLRTFGNPVLEGHFALRVSPASGNVCLAMWDLGDRVLGLGQFSGHAPELLWEVIAVVMGRKPDISIGPPEELYESDHFEAAHWQLDVATAARIGRMQAVDRVQARRWVVPSRATARRIEPLTRGLLPPVGVQASHVLWHEPAPDVRSGSKMGRPYRVGEIPRFDRTVAATLRSGRMIAPLDARAAQAVFARNGGPVLMPIEDRDGSPLGRVRVLIV